MTSSTSVKRVLTGTVAAAAVVLPVSLWPVGAGVAVVPGSISAVPAFRETVPVTHTGDAADDPAIWVNPLNDTNSLVIGNDKKGALETYRLDGTLKQRITTGTKFWGNVDVRQGVTVAGRTLDVVATTNGGLRYYTVDAATRTLSSVTDAAGGALPIRSPGVDGSCLYHAPGGALYQFVVAADTAQPAGDGIVRQYHVVDPDDDGLLSVELVRTFDVGGDSEGCVADDETGRVYVAEENVGLWRLDAAPDGGSATTSVDTVAAPGHLVHDVEGVTVAGGRIIVSAQRGDNGRLSYFTVYDSTTEDYLGAFRVVDGSGADGCQRTDGVTAYAGRLGPNFPRGMFVCQDNGNTAPGTSGNQDFKLVPLQSIPFF